MPNFIYLLENAAHAKSQKLPETWFTLLDKKIFFQLIEVIMKSRKLVKFQDYAKNKLDHTCLRLDFSADRHAN